MRGLLWAVALARAVSSTHGLICSCYSVGPVLEVVGNRTVSSEAPAPFLMSNNPALLPRTNALFKERLMSVACECTARPPRQISYLISTVQDKTCVTEADLKHACKDLADLGLMVCSTTWSSGMTGTAIEASVRSGMVEETVKRVCTQRLGACVDSVQFLGAEDRALPAAGG